MAEQGTNSAAGRPLPDLDSAPSDSATATQQVLYTYVLWLYCGAIDTDMCIVMMPVPVMIHTYILLYVNNSVYYIVAH